MHIQLSLYYIVIEKSHFHSDMLVRYALLCTNSQDVGCRLYSIKHTISETFLIDYYCGYFGYSQL